MKGTWEFCCCFTSVSNTISKERENKVEVRRAVGEERTICSPKGLLVHSSIP